jgi:hypothetical protein
MSGTQSGTQASRNGKLWHASSPAANTGAGQGGDGEQAAQEALFPYEGALQVTLVHGALCAGDLHRNSA